MTHGEPMPHTPGFYWCEKCGFYHTPVYAFCDALAALERKRDLPGWDERTRIAATMGGVVLVNPEHEPLHLNPATMRPYAPDHPTDTTRTLPDFGVHGAAIQQAVDDYLLMERKARAWDDLRAVVVVERWDKVLVLMDMKVHPAGSDSKR